MANIRKLMAAKTANLRSTAEIKSEELVVDKRPKTAPGLMGELASARERINELERHGGPSRSIPVDRIKLNPWQPRLVFDEDELQSLANSIEENGLIQPVVVIRLSGEEESYQLVVGERRLRAHQILELPEIQAIISDLTEEQIAIWSLSENLSRKDLTDFETSLAIKKIQDRFQFRTELAKALGMTRQHMYRHLSFEKLPDYIIEDLKIRPTLLGSSECANLVKVLSDYPDVADKYLPALWRQLKDEDINQSNMVKRLKKKIEDGESGEDTSKDFAYLYCKGKKAGSIKRDAIALTVRIRHEALSPEAEEAIRAVVRQWVHNE